MLSRRFQALVALLIVASTAGGDEIDRLAGETLEQILKSPDSKPLSRLSVAEITGLPGVLHDTRAALLVATTDRGNLARMLVSVALRKPPGGGGEPVPVLVLERFDTFEAGQADNRLARGRDLILFDGFRFDLDAGQVVPDGQGGDLQFQAMDARNGSLTTLGTARLFAVSGLPAARAAVASTAPTPGRTVVPGDFAGRYRLFANGLWSGVLELKVGAEGAVSGEFRSDLNGTAYPVTGRVAADVPHKVAFRVAYPRVRQDFEGLLWAEGKGAMAGTLTMLDHAYGFFALREGGRIAPEDVEVGTLPTSSDSGKTGRRVVTARKDGSLLGGEALSGSELSDRLKGAVTADPATWVLLLIPGEITFADVRPTLEAIRTGGVATIRLAPADPSP